MRGRLAAEAPLKMTRLHEEIAAGVSKNIREADRAGTFVRWYRRVVSWTVRFFVFGGSLLKAHKIPE